MFNFLKRFLGYPRVQTEPVAPYKVEAPAEPKKCGCGRSTSGLCVGLHKLSDEEWEARQTADYPMTRLPPDIEARVAAAAGPVAKVAKVKPAAMKVVKPKAPRAPKVK